uniref:RHS repeat-associated core domain-containing protein n=1 Tax=uncultured Nostoc sp. TaxID=340711 RepID=UPI0035CAD5B6
YAFNGKELDQDLGKDDYDYGMRIHDARLGRFLSVDPLTKGYPWLTPFQYASNNPIQNIDIEGLEGGEANIYNKPGVRPKFTPQQAEEMKPAATPATPVRPTYRPGSFTAWNEIHGKEYSSRVEAYRAFQSYSGEIPGETRLDRTFRRIAANHREEMLDFGGGGYNMFGGQGSAVTRVFTNGDPLVAKTANALEEASPGLVRSIERKIISPTTGQVLTDLDIETNKFVVEVGKGSATGKTAQIVERIIPNANGREVVLFGPKIGGAIEKGLNALNIKVFRNIADLAKYIMPKGTVVNLSITPLSFTPAATLTPTPTPAQTSTQGSTQRSTTSTTTTN